MGSAVLPVKVFAVLALGAYLVFSASAVRYFDPGLREKTRAVAAVHTQRRPKRMTVGRARFRISGSPLIAVVRRVRARLRPVWPPMPLHAVMPAEPTRQSGEDALGVPTGGKRSRWAALGGHGRNGPGSRS